MGLAQHPQAGDANSGVPLQCEAAEKTTVPTHEGEDRLGAGCSLEPPRAQKGRRDRRGGGERVPGLPIGAPESRQHFHGNVGPSLASTVAKQHLVYAFLATSNYSLTDS